MPLTPDELDELRESFEYNDSNHDGRIELEEFLSMLNALDEEIGREEARIGFRAVDGDGDGSISLEEFIAWWTER